MKLCPICKQTYSIAAMQSCRRCHIHLISSTDTDAINHWNQVLQKEADSLMAELQASSIQSQTVVSAHLTKLYLLGIALGVVVLTVTLVVL